MNIFKRIDQIIGNTPLLQVDPASESQAEVVLKLEYQNPGGSVKDRLALSVIEAAELDGSLQPGQRIVEATSGNTGIGLAMIAAAKGYPLTLTMPDSMSKERRRLLQAYGAQLVLTPAARGMKGAIEEAESISKEVKGFVPRQFDNAANVQIHYKTTGPEILRDTDGQLDAFVAGLGTGGTFTGSGRFLKESLPDIHLVAVEPSDSPVLSGGEPGPHKIQGIGAGFIPSIVDTDLIDEVITVSLEDALRTARELVSKKGVLTGISAGANVFAARQVAHAIAKRIGTGIGKRVITVIPSNGERYLSSILFDQIDQENPIQTVADATI